MLNRQKLDQALPALLKEYIPRNIRYFNYRIVDFSVCHNMLGIIVDPQPFEGKVVVYTDEAMIVKIGRKDFRVVDLAYVTDKPVLGSQVRVTPYACRHFDGRRIDEYEEKNVIASSGSVLKSVRMVLGAQTKLPVPQVKCPELAEMINQIQQLPAPDGVRKGVHILVDAGATDFSVVDPEPNQIVATPPTLKFKVANPKFQGEVAIIYNRGLDAYEMELRQNGALFHRDDYLLFDDLGPKLVEYVDDGLWQKIEVRVIANTKRKAA